MSRPVVGSVAEELYERLAPAVVDDEAHGWSALKLIGAICDEYLQEPSDLAEDWGQILNVDEAPAKALPWLAQVVGVVLRPQEFAETDEDYTAYMRMKIEQMPGILRGSPGALINDVKDTLTGAKTVHLNERDTSAYHFSFTTYTSQTPDDAATYAAALAQKPAGHVMVHNVVPGQTYDLLEAGYADYDAVEAAYTDYTDVENDQP